MQKDTLYIWLIGKAKLQYNGAVLEDDKRQSKKLWPLLEFLIINRNRFIPQEELLELFWPELTVNDPANSLKVLIFRMRKELDQLARGIGARLILNRTGTYGFNKDFPCVVDVEAFEQKYKEASACPDKELELLSDALKMSTAGSPILGIADTWAEAFRARYEDMYHTMFRRYISLLLDRKDYAAIVEMSERAVQLHPENEAAYYYAIKALIEQEKYVEARKMFIRARKAVFDRLDKPLDQRIVELYRKAMGNSNTKALSMNAVQENLREQSAYRGALYCEYEQFVSIYRLYERVLGRHPGEAALVMFELRPPRANRKRSLLNQHTRLLGEILAFALRSEDAFCRCSNHQFLVLFALSSDMAGVQKAGERIERCFEDNRSDPGYAVEIHFGSFAGLSMP